MQKLQIGRILSTLVGTMAVLAVGTAFGGPPSLGTCDDLDPANTCINSNGWVIEAVRTYNAGLDTTTFAYFRTNVGGGVINHIDIEWQRCQAGDEFVVSSSTGGGLPFDAPREFDPVEQFGLGTGYDIATWGNLLAGNGFVDVTLEGNVSDKPGALLANTGIFNPPATYPRTTGSNTLLVPACLFGGETENAQQEAILAGAKTVDLDDGTVVCLIEEGASGCSAVVDCATGDPAPGVVPESEVLKVEGNPVVSVSTLGEICPEYFVDNSGPNTRWYCSGGSCWPIPGT